MRKRDSGKNLYSKIVEKKWRIAFLQYQKKGGAKKMPPSL